MEQTSGLPCRQEGHCALAKASLGLFALSENLLSK